MKTNQVNTSVSEVKKILERENRGVRIDIGCGANKVKGFIGIDNRKLPGVDVVHDLERFPWPFPDECASTCVSSHVLEHINPAKVSVHLSGLIQLLLDKKVITPADIKKYVGETDFESTFIRFMDEVWRIMKPDGEFMFVVPYAGSDGYWQDPTHINGINWATVTYFDPFHPSGLYNIYRPKPWEIVHLFFDAAGFAEVLLRKRRIDPSFYEFK